MKLALSPTLSCLLWPQWGLFCISFICSAAVSVFTLSSWTFFISLSVPYEWLLLLLVCAYPSRTASPWPMCPGTAEPVSGVRHGPSMIKMQRCSPSSSATSRTTPQASALPWNATSWARQVRASRFFFYISWDFATFSGDYISWAKVDS